MRTGDIVLHKPTGEHWIVAYVDGEYMSWCGWPPGEARTADCEVVTVASDDEHWKWVRRVAEIAGNDKRARMAQRMLDERGATLVCEGCGRLTGVKWNGLCSSCVERE